MTPVVDLLTRRRLHKAHEVLTDPCHPQHRQLIDLLQTAIELDPPPGWDPDDGGEAS